MKPKLSDVAKQAGVSLATADRVINNRSGVREQTRQKVMDVVRELGYRPDPIAAQLAKTSKTKIAFIVPSDTYSIAQAVERYWMDVYDSARFARVSLNICAYEASGGSEPLDYLNEVAEISDVIVVCAADTEPLRARIHDLKAAGKLIYSLMTDLEEEATNRYVGFDQYKLGRTISYFLMLLTNRATGKILCHSMFANTKAFSQRMSGHQDFQIGQGWDADHVAFTGPSVHISCKDQYHTHSQSGQPVVGVVCWGLGCVDSFLGEALRTKSTRPKIVVVVFDMNANVVSALLEEKIDAVFYLDSALITQHAIKLALSDLEARKSIDRPDNGARSEDYLVDFSLYVKENLPEWCHALK